MPFAILGIFVLAAAIHYWWFTLGGVLLWIFWRWGSRLLEGAIRREERVAAEERELRRRADEEYRRWMEG
jgi:hypothetical protein